MVLIRAVLRSKPKISSASKSVVIVFSASDPQHLVGPNACSLGSCASTQGVILDFTAILNAVLSHALDAAPVGFYLAVGVVLAIDVVDLVLYRKTTGKLPTLLIAYNLLHDDVANKVILTVAATAGLAYFAATGDKVNAAKAVFVAGVVGSLAVEQQYLKAKLDDLFSKQIKAA